MYTGAPAMIPDRRRQWHEGPAGGILMVHCCLALLCLCGEIQRHFDRRRRRRPRTAPQDDDDDSEGDFEPGPRTTTASARRRSPRLARRARQDAVKWISEASSVLHGLFALSIVVYTVGVGIGLPPY